MTEGYRRTWLSAASRLRTQLRSAMAVGIGGFATRARRRVARSEEARGVPADEQAALRRVATLVAEAVPPGDVFTAVTAEVAGLFDVPLVGLFRYETDRAATLAAGAGKGSAYLGRRWSFAADDQSVVGSVLRTGRPLRIDDYAPVRGAVTDEARELGIGAAAGVPVIVSGRVWGAVVLAAGHDRPPLPADTLDRLAAFTDLVATAIANSDAQTKIERLAGEQAALRRVATLVARQPSPEEVFAAVTEEAGKLLHLDTAHLVVYEGDGTATTVGAWGVRAAQLPAGTRFPLEAET